MVIYIRENVKMKKLPFSLARRDNVQDKFTGSVVKSWKLRLSTI